MLIESFNAYHISLHFWSFKKNIQIIFSTREKQMRGDKMTSSKYKKSGKFYFEYYFKFWSCLVIILFAKSALVALGKLFSKCFVLKLMFIRLYILCSYFRNLFGVFRNSFELVVST